MIRVDSLVKVDLFVLIGLIDSNKFRPGNSVYFGSQAPSQKKVQEPKKKKEGREKRKKGEKRKKREEESK